MSFILTGLSSLLGLFGGLSQVKAVQAAGQAQQQQAVQFLQDNQEQTKWLAGELNQASKAGVASNAWAGKYSITQNAQTALFDTQYKLAGKWMQVLSGAS